MSTRNQTSHWATRHEQENMQKNLPYLTAPGTVKSAFEKIRSAATPPRVTGDFVNTVLQIKGGTGASIPPFLKRIGFVASDGTPSEIYKRFRNHNTGGSAVAEAIKIGYADLARANEYFYRLDDTALLNLIVQVTGVEANNRTAGLTLSTLKALKTFADFEAEAPQADREQIAVSLPEASNGRTEQTFSSNGRVGLNLSYTINLNLPATSDQAVFNAIFRSLKEHLLSGNE